MELFNHLQKRKLFYQPNTYINTEIMKHQSIRRKEICNRDGLLSSGHVKASDLINKNIFKIKLVWCPYLCNIIMMFWIWNEWIVFSSFLQFFYIVGVLLLFDSQIILKLVYILHNCQKKKKKSFWHPQISCV